MIKFRMPLLAVRDVEISKKFYHDLFDQEVVLDLGGNVTFSGGFSVQYPGLRSTAEETTRMPPHACTRTAWPAYRRLRTGSLPPLPAAPGCPGRLR